MQTTTEQSSLGGWVILFLGFTFIVAAFDGCNESTTTTTTSSGTTYSQSSPEYRYAKERFKQEGLSDSDARTAADAVIKFHNAQQNR